MPRQRSKYIVHIEYSVNNGEHPVFIQISDGSVMFAEVAGKTLSSVLKGVVQRIVDREQNAG
jgi:hypothetical protein